MFRSEYADVPPVDLPIHAAALAETGVRRGDALAPHSPHTVAFPLAFYAATRAGACVTTVHPPATAEESAVQLRDSGARRIVTVPPPPATARWAAELAGGVREILVCDSAPGHRSLIDAVPRAASGKILRRELRERP